MSSLMLGVVLSIFTSNCILSTIQCQNSEVVLQQKVELLPVWTPYVATWQQFCCGFPHGKVRNPKLGGSDVTKAGL